MYSVNVKGGGCYVDAQCARNDHNFHQFATDHWCPSVVGGQWNQSIKSVGCVGRHCQSVFKSDSAQMCKWAVCTGKEVGQAVFVARW